VHSAAARIVAAARPVAGRRRFVVARLALPLGVVVAVGGMASANGAYFPTSWGWPAIAFGWTALLAVVVVPSVELSRLEWMTVSALAALTAWTAASTAWSADVTQTGLEVERTLVYLTGVGAALLVLRRGGVNRFLGALLTAIAAVSAYALATRLFPERLAKFDLVAVNRLEQPLGYWNSLGTFCAMGALLALGFAARARSMWARVLAAATLPILLATLYFTFGRGAWIALGIGIAAAVALDGRRLQLITTLLGLALPAALAVWLASRSDALTNRRFVLSAASHDGHRLAPIMVVLALASAALTLVLALAGERLRPPPRVRTVYAAAICGLLAAGVVAFFAAYGAPWSVAQRAYHSFSATGEARQDLNQRLFTFAGSGRADFWAVAWHEARQHPLLGSGAGTYEQYWLRLRSIESDVRDAHSLYLEMLAELGPVGLALVVIALAAPLLAAIRARRNLLVPVAFGSYVVYLVHAAADWDWEMTAVTLTALLCGVVLLVSARGERPRPLAGGTRAAVAAVALAAVAFSFVGLMANTAASASREAALAENWTRAAAEARRASRWAPWSAQGWQALGEARLQQGHLREARASLRQALAKEPRNWSLWLDLAFASKGRERREALRHAVELNPRGAAMRRAGPGP
jgi:hypothetical protein